MQGSGLFRVWGLWCIGFQLGFNNTKTGLSRQEGAAKPSVFGSAGNSVAAHRAFGLDPKPSNL